MSDLTFHTAPALRGNGSARDDDGGCIRFEKSYAGGDAIFVRSLLRGTANPFIDGPALRDALIAQFPLPVPAPVAPAEPENPFSVGDRVVVAEHSIMRELRGTVGRVRSFGGTAIDPRGVLVRMVRVDFPGVGTRTLYSSSLLPAPLDEPGDPVGSIAYVTGDSHGTGHGFPVGTEVEITSGGWYEHDGDYLAKPVGTGPGSAEYVSTADLDVEAPFVPVPVGTFVRVTSKGRGVKGSARHYLAVGSIARVASAPTSPDENYRLSGTFSNGTPGSQWVGGDSVEVAE